MLTIHLSAQSDAPMYEQIYRHIRNEIRNGSLTCSEKLPSTRKLASHLQVSRNTVDMAYSQLLSEGYIESHPKCGFFVCKITELSHLSDTTEPIVPNKQSDTMQYRFDFSPFAIDINHFPFATWRKLSRECTTFDNNELFLLGEKQGDLSFRQAIKKYLHDSRGVNCEENQILIGAGADYLLHFLCLLLPNNCKIAMENPTYRQAYKIFRGLDLKTIPISLTPTGIDLDALSLSDADICYVTPSHQYPVGTVMPYTKRLQLLKWANEKEHRYIIEDDHDSEFRYRGKPIPALSGMDTNQKVIYLGTFSRALAPAIRIGYIVLPKPLLLKYQQSYSYYSSTVSRVDQAILTSFIQGGYFERHLNRMRKIYKSKHDTLLAAFKVFRNKIRVHTENAGLHVLVLFLFPLSCDEILKIAAENQIHLYPLRDHFIAPTGQTNENYFLFGFGNLTEEEIKEGIQCLNQALLSASSATASANSNGSA